LAGQREDAVARIVSRVLPAVAMATAAILLPMRASGQTSPPRLRYEPPVDLLHSAIRPPENYESTRINASLQVYVFRPAPADVAAAFRQTMLRDWIDPQYQEMQVAGQPVFGALSISGADAAYMAQFAEAGFGGMTKPRVRLLIVARGSAAIIDAQAASPQAWQIAAVSFNALLATVRVETAATSTSAATPATRALAGLYVGVKQKFVSAIGVGAGAGSGGFVPALHMYLLSETGRVYRAFDEILAPGGDIRRFDFDAAEQADPVNSGHFMLQGDQLLLTLGERSDERIAVPLRQPGHLVIGTVDYTRR
jgi:hypothetical protein